MNLGVVCIGVRVPEDLAVCALANEFRSRAVFVAVSDVPDIRAIKVTANSGVDEHWVWQEAFSRGLTPRYMDPNESVFQV